MFKLDDKTENTQSILTRARDLVAVGWCQYAHAKTEEGHVVEALHRDACAYCTTGAVIRAMYERNPDMDEDEEDEERHCAVAALDTTYNSLTEAQDEARKAKDETGVGAQILDHTGRTVWSLPHEDDDDEDD